MTSPFDDWPEAYDAMARAFARWRRRHEEEILQAYDGARRLDAIRNLYLGRSQSEDISPLDLLTFFNMVGEILGET